MEDQADRPSELSPAHHQKYLFQTQGQASDRKGFLPLHILTLAYEQQRIRDAYTLKQCAEVLPFIEHSVISWMLLVYCLI